MSLTLVLGNKSYSSWSMRPWFLLKMLGISFEEVLLDLGSPDFAARAAPYTPSGRVPVLLDGKMRIWESLAIIDHVADRYPEKDVWPRAAEPRAFGRAISSEMHAGFAGLRSHYTFNIRKKIPGRAATPAADADISRIRTIWSEARRRFGAGGPYLFGAFSAADAMFAPVVSRFETYGIDAGPEGRAYMAAIAGLPAYAEWRAAALLEREVEKYEIRTR